MNKRYCIIQICINILITLFLCSIYYFYIGYIYRNSTLLIIILLLVFALLLNICFNILVLFRTSRRIKKIRNVCIVIVLSFIIPISNLSITSIDYFATVEKTDNYYGYVDLEIKDNKLESRDIKLKLMAYCSENEYKLLQENEGYYFSITNIFGKNYIQSITIIPN